MSEFAVVAQLAERVPRKHKVAGSIPAVGYNHSEVRDVVKTYMPEMMLTMKACAGREGTFVPLQDYEALESVAERLQTALANAHARADAAERALPPAAERGPWPGEGTWSVFAEKVVEERDEARRRLAALAEVAENVCVAHEAGPRDDSWVSKTQAKLIDELRAAVAGARR